MRQIYIFFFLCCFFCFNARGQASFQLGANGSILTNPFEQNVAFYHESTHPVLDQPGEWHFKLGPLDFGRTVNLNEEGQYQSTLTYFGEDAQVYLNTQFEYNTAGQVQLVTEKFIYSDQPILIKYEWENAKASIPTSAKTEMNGETKQEIKYESKKRGRWEENIIGINKNERIVVEREADQIQAYRFYQADGSLRERHALVYNEEGLLVQTTIYSPNEELLSSIELSYLYDQEGNWIKRLAHDKRSGRYTLTQRQIGYRQQLTEAKNHHAVKGLWHSVNQQMKLMIDVEGTFTLFELGENVMTNGTWNDNGLGQAELKMGKSNRIRFRNLFQQGWKFTAELEPGRLIMHRDGRHYEFVANWFAPIPVEMVAALKFAQWEEGLWEKPGHRDPKAIPTALQQGFSSVRAVVPNRFVACVESNLCGLVDETAYPIIPFAYEALSLAFPGHYIVHQDGKRGLVDSLGQLILPIKYEAIWPETAFGSLVVGTRENGKRYYYDLQTASFWPYEKDKIMGFNDTRFVINDQYWFLTDKNFEPISSDRKYYSIKILTPNRYLAMGTQRDHYILDAAGVEVAEIGGFQSVRTAVYGYLTGRNRNDNLSALLDYNGQQLTEPLYESLQFCTSRKQEGDLCSDLRKHNALAKYRKPNGEEGYLNGMGKEAE